MALATHRTAQNTADKSSSSPTELPPERKKEIARRRRNPLSCAECRRLKLRCDRVFPCESCRKRGCATICPEGALTTKGTRFVLANTEELHVKIIHMSERIRQLEDAIAASHTSPEPHPLLKEDLLQIKIPTEFKKDEPHKTSSNRAASSESGSECPTSLPEILSAFGTLKIGSDGYSKFFGQTARTEHFLEDDKETAQLEIAKSRNSVPPDILHICQAFPFGAISEEHRLAKRISSFLPSYDEAWRLTETYYSNASFVYVPCQRQQFTEILQHVYDHAQEPEKLSKHRLALVFAILAHGAHADLTIEPYSSYAEQFQLLSRASLAITPLLAEPSIYAIQALHLLALYNVLSNKPDGSPVGWAIQALAVKLAQALGLHRDLESLGAGEQDKSQGEIRRWVFWEVITLEGWLSMGLGRPPTIDFAHFDCKLPAPTRRAMAEPDAALHTWHTWKHGFAILVNRILKKALDIKTPPYSEILDLDRSIQKYSMPPDMENMVRGLPISPPPPEQTPGLTMQRTILLAARYTAVLLLHRGFFTQALNERNDPMQSKYAPSVLASYRSACFVIMALYTAYEKHPELTCRFGLYWSNVFSATISLCLLVTRATSSSYAPLALDHLDLAYDLIQRAAPICYTAGKVLPMAKKLYEKAHAALTSGRNHQLPSSVAYRQTTNGDEDDDEELEVLGGKTNVVSEQISAKGQVSRPQLTYPESPGLPLEMPQMNHLDSVHPSLVQYVAETHCVSDQSRVQHLNQGYECPTTVPSAQHESSYQPHEQYMNHLGEYNTYVSYESGTSKPPRTSTLEQQYSYYNRPYEPEE